MCDSNKGSFSQSPMKICQSVWIQWPFFFKNWTKGHWPLDDLWHERMWIQSYSDNFSKLNQKVNDPKMTFDPTSIEVTCVTLPKDHFLKVPWKYVKVCGYSDPFFFQKLEPKVIDPRCVTLPKDHCVQVLWKNINVCGYSDQFCKIPHTYYAHTTYILCTYYICTTYRISDHIVSFWTKFRWDKKT